MENKHVVDLLPAYSLEALNPDEMVRVEAHLEDCAGCREELKAYQAIAGDLSLAVPLRQPPEKLRQRVLDRAAGGDPVPDRRSSSAGWWAGLVGWFNRLAPAWGIVSLVLVVVLGVSNILLRQQPQQVRQVGKFQVIAMAPTDNAPDASGVLVISGDGMDGTLVVEHLPDLDQASQYQLWLIREGQRTSGGVFSLEEDGYGYLVVTAPDSLLSYDSFGVTIEPYGGSPGPTGGKVMGGDL